MDIIDAYTHCGLSKYEPIDQVRRVMKHAGVGRAVLAQHLGEFNNDYIGGIAADDPDHFAAVCMVDHTAADRVAVLRRLADSGRIRGLRLTTDACAAAPDLMAAAADAGLVIVLYAPDGIEHFVDKLDRFLDVHAGARVVVTHMGSPDLSKAPDLADNQRVFELSRHRGLYYQVSGMKMVCPHPHEQLHGLIETACERFGSKQLVWGSNYPVVGGQTDYAMDLHLLLDGKLPVPADAIPLIAGENARRLWFEVA